MPTVSETSLQAVMAIGVPATFGTITPSFERLLGYVDASSAPVGARIVWKLYAISGGVRSLAAISDPIPSGAKPYVVFAEPNEGDGLGVSMIAGTTYEMVGIAQDGPLPNVRAGFVGYDVEVNTQPNEVSAVSAGLVFGTEVVFGSLALHHARVQVQFDPAGVQNTAATLRVYGTITGGAGPITAVIAEGTQPNKATDPTIPISLAGLGFVTAQLRIQSTNPQIAAGAVTGVIVGADVNLDISGGGGGITQLIGDVLAGPGAGVQTATVVGLQGRPVSAAVPVLGDALVWNGAAWAPGLTTAFAAVGLDIVFRPGGVAGGNVYTTWTTAFNAASLALVQGPVSIAVDDSIAPANVDAGVWNMSPAGRAIKITVGNPTGSAALNIPAGATLVNPTEFQSLLTVTVSPTNPAVPGLSFNQAFGVVTFRNGATYDSSGGTVPGSVVTPGSTLVLIVEGGAFTGVLGAECFSIGAGASIYTNISNCQSASPSNFMSGTGSLFWNRDALSFFPIADANFTGTLINSTGSGQLCWNAVDFGVGTYIIDATFLAGGNADVQVFASPTGPGTTIIRLPESSLPGNQGRHLRIISVLSSAINTMTLNLQNPGDKLQGVVGGSMVLSGGVGTAWLIETDGVNGWFVQLVGADDIDIAASFVFQPGGPSPVGATNVYLTEASLWAAINAALTTTAGTLVVEVDSSLAPATFALPHDCQHRIQFLPANSIFGNVLTLADGATLTDPAGVGTALQIVGTCTTAPAFLFSGTAVFELQDSASLVNNGAHAFCDIPAGVVLVVISSDASAFEITGAGSFFDLLDATSVLQTELLTGTATVDGLGNPSTQFVSGVAGSQWFLLQDASCLLLPQPGFLGTLVGSLLDDSTRVGYGAANTVAPPSWLLPQYGVSSVRITQDTHHSPFQTKAAAYTIDATQLDGTIFSSASGIGQVFSLPQAALWPGREITIKDVTNSIGGVLYQVAPFAGDTIEGVAANFPQNTPLGSYTLKSDGATGWWII